MVMTIMICDVDDDELSCGSCSRQRVIISQRELEVLEYQPATHVDFP